MSFLREFLIGFTQPLRDFIVTFLVYSAYSFLGFPLEPATALGEASLFNIWLFLEIFVIIAVLDHVAGMVRDALAPPGNLMDVNMRLPGAAMGVFVWSAGLVDAYTTMGGAVLDAVVSVVVAGACVLAGIYVRTRVSINRSQERSRMEREFRP